MKFWPNQYISFKVVCVEGLLTRILNVLAEKNIIRSCQLNDQLETRSSSIFSEPADHSTVLNLQYSEVQHWYLPQGSGDSCKDLLELGICINIAISILLAVKQISANHLNLQPSCHLRSSFSSHLHLVSKLVLKLLLQLAELGGVPSPTTISNMYFDCHVGIKVLECIILTNWSMLSQSLTPHVLCVD